MSDSTSRPNEQDAIQRAEDVRQRRPPVAPPSLQEAIQQPTPSKPAPPPDRERDLAKEGIPYHRAEASEAPPAAARVNRSLIGQTIRERRGFMFGAATWTLLAMLLVTIAAITVNVHVALAAIGPVAAALMLVLMRRKPFTVHVEEDRLVFQRPALTLPLTAIEEVIAGGHKREAFLICYANGFIGVPAALNIPWQAFREFLKDNLQPQLFTPRLSSRLQKYFDRNAALFGGRRMQVYWARDRIKPVNRPGRAGLAVCIGLGATGLLWFVIGVSQGRAYDGWFGTGLLFAILGFLIGVLFFMHGIQRAPRLKNWQQSALVLGPAGLALEQGELVGELRWEEVKKIGNKSRGTSFSLDNRATQPCVRLDVAGASIMVFDLYNRPLFYLHDVIDELWHDAQR